MACCSTSLGRPWKPGGSCAAACVDRLLLASWLPHWPYRGRPHPGAATRPQKGAGPPRAAACGTCRLTNTAVRQTSPPAPPAPPGRPSRHSQGCTRCTWRTWRPSPFLGGNHAAVGRAGPGGADDCRQALAPPNRRPRFKPIGGLGRSTGRGGIGPGGPGAAPGTAALAQLRERIERYPRRSRSSVRSTGRATGRIRSRLPERPSCGRRAARPRRCAPVPKRVHPPCAPDGVAGGRRSPEQPTANAAAMKMRLATLRVR